MVRMQTEHKKSKNYRTQQSVHKKRALRVSQSARAINLAVTQRDSEMHSELLLSHRACRPLWPRSPTVLLGKAWKGWMEVLLEAAVACTCPHTLWHVSSFVSAKGHWLVPVKSWKMCCFSQ